MLEDRRLLAVDPLGGGKSVIWVDSLADGPIDEPSAAPTTLREAIHEANFNSTGADVIQFDPALAGGTIRLWGIGMEFVVAEDLAIAGLGKDQLTIDGQDWARHFRVNPGVTLTLSGITLTNGNAGEGTSGGAIYSDGPVVVTDSVLSNNRAGQSGGAIYGSSDCTAVTLTNCLLSGNKAIDYGGAVAQTAGSMKVDATTVRSNAANQAGGLYSEGPLEILGGSLIESNTAVSSAGGVQANATIAISQSTFNQNQAGGWGGGLYGYVPDAITVSDSQFTKNTALQGGGMFLMSGSSATLTRVTCESNQATAAGGLYCTNMSTVDISQCVFRGNTATTSVGGGLWATTTAVTVRDNTLFEANIANTYGGGIHLSSGSGVLLVKDSTFHGNQTLVYDGGAVYSNRDISISGSRFESNTAKRNAGAIWHSTTTLTVDTSWFEDNTASTGDGGALRISGAGLVANSTFRNNRCADDGGAVFTTEDDFVFTILQCLIEKNVAGTDGVGNGGAIRTSRRRLEVSGSTIRDNTTDDSGGGIYVYDGAMVLTDSLVAVNSATNGNGGGIYLANTAEFQLANSTLSGNTAAQAGGGLYDAGIANMARLVHATITANRADAGGSTGQLGGGISTLSTNLRLENSIVAGNFHGSVAAASDVDGLLHPATSCSLAGDAASAGGLTGGIQGNLVGVDPLLGPLQDNGGPTQTHAVSAGSPAVDAGDNVLSLAPDGEPLWYDQRGYDFDRLVGLQVDLGAYELRQSGGELSGRKWFDLDQDGSADDNVWGTSIVSDGGFEEGDELGSWAAVPSGSLAIPGWQIRRSVQWVGSSWTAAEGGRSVHLYGTYGSVSQVLVTEPGRRYRVQFAMAGAPVIDPGLKTLRVWAAGTHADFSFDTTGRTDTNMGWTTEGMSMEFVAQETRTEMVFESITPGSTAYGPVIDNVVVLPFGRDDVRIYLDEGVRNGVYDPGEPLAYLRRDDPNTPDVDETGTYRFTGLPDGDYSVHELLADGFEQVAPGAPGSYERTIAGGQSYRDLDFGNRWDGQISGTKFIDLNNNGIRDRNPLPGNPPTVLMAIDVSNTTNRSPGFTVTDQNNDGKANWVLDAEIYAMLTVRQELEDLGFGSTARVGVVVFASEGVALDMDPQTAGVQCFVSPTARGLGDSTSYVEQVLRSIQRNHTGTGTGRSDFEAGLEAAISSFGTLTPLADASLLFTSDGLSDNPWSFDDEVASLDGLGVSRVAWGFGDICDVADLRRIDPFAQRLTSLTQVVDKATARSRVNRTADGRWLEDGKPGVTIYLDLDGNGLLSAGDPSTVTRDDDPATGGVDETGWYAFEGLPIGQYIVREVVPDGYEQTAPRNPNYYQVDLRTGPIAAGYDFGNRELPGGLWGYKYLDADYDGVYESGEPGQSGVTIYLDLNNNGRKDTGEPTAVTDSKGRFQFTNLTPGTYVVRESTPAGYDQTLPANHDPITIVVAPGKTMGDLLFLNWDLRGCVLGLKWIDLDGDGQRDPLEPGLPGVRIFLDVDGDGVWDGNEPYAWTQSDDPATAGVDESGAWKIDSVVPGTYTVREVSPSGYDSKFPASGQHSVIVGPRGQVDTNTAGEPLWFGNVPNSPSIEGWKFDDRNQNRQRDRNRFQGGSPLLVLTVDISDSTKNPFAGDPPGDVNGDGGVDEVLDGELAGLIAVNQALIDRGLAGTVSLAIVVLADQGYVVDMDPATGGVQRTASPSAGVAAILRSLTRAAYGSALQTNYEKGLQTVISTIAAENPPAGSANLLFVSDGNPNNLTNYDDEVTNLRAMQVNLNAFGAGRDAYLYPLQKIDPEADRFTSPADLVAKFFGTFDPGDPSSASWPMTSADGRWLERGLPNVTVYLDDNDNARLDWTDRNGNGIWDAGEGERWTLTAWDDPATTGVDETGYYRFDNLAPGTYTVREIVPSGWTETTPTGEDFNGLAAFYPFEGNANSATGVLPAGTVVGATFTADRFGNANSAISFDGVDDEVQLGSWFTYQDFTLAMWVNTGPTQKTYADIVDNNHTSGQNWVVQQSVNDTNNYAFFTAGTNAPADAFRLTTGVWQYLVLTHSSRDRTNAVYLDGAALLQNVGTATAITYANSFLRLGNWGGGGRNWNGLMDDLRIYSRQLTANEVNHLYALETRQVTASPGYVVRVDYGDLVDGIDFGNYDPNGPPEVVLAHVVQAIAENADTTAATPVADVVPVDSSLDPATLVLTGADAGQFEIVSGKLYLKSGVLLDHETNPRLEVTVQTTTPAGDIPDPAATLFITVTDVNERPSVRLTNARTLLAGDANTSSRWKAADIAIEDDALGTNNLSLAGSDAAMFEIVAQALYLKAGAVLNYSANPVLDVTVEVDDPDVGVSPDGTASLAVKLTDPGLPTLDVDANGLVEPMSDGMLVLRYCFDFAGPALVSRVLGSGATRTEPGRVAAFLGTACSSMLDVDGSGAREPFADGLLLLRYLFDFRGTALTRGLIGSTAQRTTPEAIVAFLDGFLATGAKLPAKENATAETIVGVDKAAPYEVTVPLKRRDRHHFRLSDGL